MLLTQRTIVRKLRDVIRTIVRMFVVRLIIKRNRPGGNDGSPVV
ncbi:hypothetical protein ACFQ3W_00085 [Paenibacillus puldeungensis]|uniref:Uncharacterized protein n=1 Tax=Paenibacillus puldeungensis TaxID=696536 RepID=A0ABW3RQH0_9BACL